MNDTLHHRHGRRVHSHPHRGAHRHVRSLRVSQSVAPEAAHHHDHDEHDHHHDHDHDHDHDQHRHAHGWVDPSIVRSRAGVRAVTVSLAVLAFTAVLQAAVFVVSGSVALLADLVHNGGDALTAIPLGIAFFLGSERGERRAGYFVVFAIFVSASIAAYESIDRLFHPEHLDHLAVLAAAGVLGFVGNEIAARVRLAAGRRLGSAALVADGAHARVDGFVSLGVVGSAIAVAAGFPRADPIVGLAISGLLLKITWDAWRTVTADA